MRMCVGLVVVLVSVGGGRAMRSDVQDRNTWKPYGLRQVAQPLGVNRHPTTTTTTSIPTIHIP